MVNIIIDGRKISVPADTTIMEAAQKSGIDIPHLCYLKEINEIGACRVCLVEVVGMDKLVTACNTKVEEGMEICYSAHIYRLTPEGKAHKRLDKIYRNKEQYSSYDIKVKMYCSRTFCVFACAYCGNDRSYAGSYVLTHNYGERSGERKRPRC